MTTSVEPPQQPQQAVTSLQNVAVTLRRQVASLMQKGTVAEQVLTLRGPMKWVEVATKAEDIRRVLAELAQEGRHDVRQRAARSFCPPPPEQLGLGFG